MAILHGRGGECGSEGETLEGYVSRHTGFYCYNDIDMSKEYYYIDIDLQTMAIVAWGTTPNATHTGKTENPAIHRVFLTKGQFNKLAKHLG